MKEVRAGDFHYHITKSCLCCYYPLPSISSFSYINDDTVCMYVGQRTCPSEIRFRNGFKDFDIGLQGYNDNDVAVRGDPPFSNPRSAFISNMGWVIDILSVTWNGL